MSFPRAVWVIVGVFSLLLLGTLAAQLAVVSSQLKTNKDQRNLIKLQLRETRPLVKSAEPLARETLENLPEAQRMARRADRLSAAAIPLVTELRRAGLDSAARAVQALTANLLRADVGSAAAAGRDLAHDLLRIGPGDTLARTADSAALIPPLLQVQRRAFRFQRRSVRIQRRSEAIQRRTLAMAEQILGVAVETEKHAESLDRKLGGAAP